MFLLALLRSLPTWRLVFRKTANRQQYRNLLS